MSADDWGALAMTPLGLRIRSRLVIDPQGCWIWQGAKTSEGYGHIRVNGRFPYTHRTAYELLRGPIADGLVIDHACCRPPCANPDHMEPVTRAENTARGYAIPIRVATRRSGPCKRGHPRTPENVRINPDGKIACRPCQREDARRYYAAKKAAS